MKLLDIVGKQLLSRTSSHVTGEGPQKSFWFKACEKRKLELHLWILPYYDLKFGIPEGQSSNTCRRMFVSIFLIIRDSLVYWMFKFLPALHVRTSSHNSLQMTIYVCTLNLTTTNEWCRLTRRNVGLRYFQQILQYKPGRWPIISFISLQNWSIPRINLHKSVNYTETSLGNQKWLKAIPT